jgi:spermidine synthase
MSNVSYFQMWKYVDVGEGQKIFHKIDSCVFLKKTKYQLLEITKTTDFGNVLFLDGDPQSSELDEHIFNECLVHPAMLGHKKPKTVFIGGGGTGLTLREVLRHKMVSHVDIVDIDKEVVDICKKFYNFAARSFSDPRTHLHHDDARHFLTKSNSKYDCVFLDTTMPHHNDIAAPLYRKEFFEIAKEKMTPNGVFATAANSADFRYSTRFASIVKTLERVFDFVTPYTAYTPLFGQEWAFVFASDSIDPTHFKPSKIDKTIEKRSLKLNFYDGITHKKIFSLDKKTRNMLKKEGVILSDSRGIKDTIFVPELPSHNLENYINIVNLDDSSMLRTSIHNTF